MIKAEINALIIYLTLYHSHAILSQLAVVEVNKFIIIKTRTETTLFPQVSLKFIFHFLFPT